MTLKVEATGRAAAAVVAGPAMTRASAVEVLGHLAGAVIPTGLSSMTKALLTDQCGREGRVKVQG
jgi:hypothetical protein